jgi:hypothetical protein
MPFVASAVYITSRPRPTAVVGAAFATSSLTLSAYWRTSLVAFAHDRGMFGQAGARLVSQPPTPGSVPQPVMLVNEAIVPYSYRIWTNPDRWHWEVKADSKVIAGGDADTSVQARVAAILALWARSLH